MNQLGQMIHSLINNSDELYQSDIVERFSNSGDRRVTRRFPLTTAAQMVGVSRQTIYNAMKNGIEHPLLQGGLGGNPDLYQIQALREHFNTQPHQDYCINMVISGHKGGGWKTTTGLYLGQWLAMKGYRVLLVSVDPQGSLNLALGVLPDQDITADDTLLPFFLGKRPDARYAVRDTYFPNLKLIPSSLQMARVEDEVAKLGEDGKLRYPSHMLLAMALDGLRKDFDIIIVDGPPNLGLGTVNCVFAADVVLCPTPVDRLGFYSTRQYLEMLKDLLQPFEETDFIPTVRFLGTHFERAAGSDSQDFFNKMRQAWGNALLSVPLCKTPQISRGYDTMRTIYEQEPSDRSSFSAYKNALTIFDDVFTEIKNTLLDPIWRG